MKNETKQKLHILYSSKNITSDDMKYLITLDKDLSKYEEGMKEEMLLMHVAMSLNRARQKKSIMAMPEELWNQISKKKMYNKAKKYWNKKSSKLPIALNTNEERYIIMHIINVMNT